MRGLRALVPMTFMVTFALALLPALALADDCQAIRTAIESLPLKGGTIHLKPQVYICDTPVVLDRNNAKLDGGGKATLKLADGADSPLLIMGEASSPPAAVYNVSVVGLTLDGNKDNQTMECWGATCDSTEQANIRNNALTIRGVVGATITNVIAENGRSGGVVTERLCYHLHVNGLKSFTNYFDGLAGYATYESDFTNIELANNNAAGLSMDIDFNDNIFKNLSIHDNHDVGIFMRASNDNTFSNLKIANSGNHGIFLAYVDGNDTCADDNVFNNTTITGSNGYGFRLNNVCNGIRFTGTTILSDNKLGCMSQVDGATIQTEAVKCQN